MLNKNANETKKEHIKNQNLYKKRTRKEKGTCLFWIWHLIGSGEELRVPNCLWEIEKRVRFVGMLGLMNLEEVAAEAEWWQERMTAIGL